MNALPTNENAGLAPGEFGEISKTQTTPAYFTEPPSDNQEWDDGDRQWFAENPRRAFLLRRQYPGETQLSILPCAFMAVCQVAPGMFDRRPLTVPDAESVLMLPQSEEFAASLWHKLGDGERTTVGEVAAAVMTSEVAQ